MIKQKKHDMIEKVQEEFEEKYGEDQTEEMEDELDEEIRKISQQMEAKRQQNKLVLRNKLNDIIQDQDMNIDDKLLKLEESEINEFIQSLME